jgi:hypothetical protein
MILNAQRVPDVSVVAPQRGRHHFDVELMRGRKRNLVALMSRQGEAAFTIATADGAPLCIAFPGPRYPELPRDVRGGTE